MMNFIPTTNISTVFTFIKGKAGSFKVYKRYNEALWLPDETGIKEMEINGHFLYPVNKKIYFKFTLYSKQTLQSVWFHVYHEWGNL